MCFLGSACASSGGVSESECCRLPGVIRELWNSIRLCLWSGWKEKGSRGRDFVE